MSGAFIFWLADVLCNFYLYFFRYAWAVTLNAFNDGKYDGNFIDSRIPRLLPVISEFESKLFPITRAVKKRYFTNIDVENEDEFRPRYVEVRFRFFTGSSGWVCVIINGICQSKLT
jgi:hypothetical protein